MFIVNRLDTSRIAVIAKALGLTAICIVAMVATVHTAPIAIATMAALAATTLGIVAAVAVAITHAAIFAALALVLPFAWRMCRWLWAHREGVAVLAKGLALWCLVVGVFVAACVWGPVLVAALPSVATVAGVFGGFIAAAGKVM